MEVLELPGYTEEEKLQIVDRHLIPKASVRERARRPEDRVHRAKRSREIIRSHTREAGLRNLEREIARVCRKIARSITEGETAPEHDHGADAQEVSRTRRVLLRGRRPHQRARRRDRTRLDRRNGGDIIFIESTRMSRAEGAHADRLARRRDEGIRAGRALLHSLARRCARDRRRLLRKVRHPRARPRGRDPQRRPLRRRDHRRLARLAAHSDAQCATTSR